MAEFAIDQTIIEQLVLKAVQDNILTAVENMAQDPAWLSRIEQLINQTVTHQTIARIGSIDINTIIRDRVDENIEQFQEKLRENFSSIGIKDQASQTQLTIMDDHTVFENTLTARELHIVEGAIIKDLAVTGSINVDNLSWDALSSSIATKTLAQINEDWQDQLVQQVSDRIKANGVDFDQITLGGEPLINNGSLSRGITESNLQTVGNLRSLRVLGETHLNETVNVVRKRIGINTEEPEMALSVWDEEVAINIGKNKEKQAYVGTSRAQGLTLGVNRVGQLTIDPDGLTTIKKLQIGLHKISHDIQVPGWSGTRGDIVFNSNPTDSVFAWVCLGAFKWKPLKSAE